DRQGAEPDGRGSGRRFKESCGKGWEWCNNGPRVTHEGPMMMRPIERTGRGRLGLSCFLACLALTIPLVLPLSGQAAAPAVATRAAGLAGQGHFGTSKGRLVWGGDAIPPVRVLAEVGKAQKDPNVCARDKPILSREVNVDPKTKGVAFGFAYLTRPKGRN